LWYFRKNVIINLNIDFSFLNGRKEKFNNNWLSFKSKLVDWNYQLNFLYGTEFLYCEGGLNNEFNQ